MPAVTVDKEGTGSQRQDMLCLPGTRRRRVEEGGSGARDCKEDPFALLYLSENLPSASCVLP